MISLILLSALATAQSTAGSWTVAAIYDHSAVVEGGDVEVKEPEFVDPLLPPVDDTLPGFVWQTSPEMEERCGPAKRPDRRQGDPSGSVSSRRATTWRNSWNRPRTFALIVRPRWRCCGPTPTTWGCG